MLIRANVPVFGSAYMRSDHEKLAKWYLEFGAGRTPTKWSRIKESDKAVSDDPYPQGKVQWNVNKEPPGNLTNWAVGLASYNYQNWGKNLNGIYTLRLVAESENGAVAETRRTAFVGEAVVRALGGTGISSDLKCRLLIPAFSFDGHQGKVVAIVKQVPPPSFGKCKTVSGVEEVSPLTDKIYETTKGFTLASAIYRVYPNGLQTEPASSLEIDFDPAEFSAPSSKLNVGEPILHQWNVLANVWEPLQTQWFGNTAKADVYTLSPETTYVALMKRTRPITSSEIQWNSISALSGFWEGITDPHVTVRVSSSPGQNAETQSDENGRFRLPYRLRAGVGSYRFNFTSLDEKTPSLSKEVLQKGGELVLPNAPSLSFVGESSLAEQKKVLVYCQDPSLAEKSTKEKRSVIVQARNANYSLRFAIELAELLPGSGNFIGSITLPGAEAISPHDSIPANALPPNLPDNDKIILSIAGASLSLDIRDIDPPRAVISSPTHPSLLFLTPSTGILKGGRIHSLCDISLVDNVWKLAGIQGQSDSARIVPWPVNGFSVSSWPFIAFTYKTYNPARWQILLRSQSKMASFHLGTPNAYLPAYAATGPLVADGEWHHWQQNLNAGTFKQIDSVAFGSWINTGLLRADPGFTDYRRDTILIKSLWIGKSYKERAVEMAWRLEDSSPIARLEWWVDQEAEAPSEGRSPSELTRNTLPGPVPLEGKCSFRLPDDGKWFFHLRATDSAGNTTPITSYPIIVYSTDGKREALVKSALEEPTELHEVTWEQPDGEFKVKLPNLGAALNPTSLALRIGKARYPIVKSGWNAGSEELTINVKAFEGGAPLGFNGEELIIRLEGDDLEGKRIHTLPAFKVKFVSPFAWTPSEEGGKLSLVDNDVKSPWHAFWRDFSPPWQKHFPGSVNNVLVITRPDLSRRVKPTRFLRPISIINEEIRESYWEESWLDPSAKRVEMRDTFDKVAFNSDGTRASILHRPEPTNPKSDSWILVQSASDPFEESTLRVMNGRKSRYPESIARVGAKDAIAMLNSQTNTQIRMDVWLPPRNGRFALKAPGNREVVYAVGDDPTYSTASRNAIKIEAGEEWTKVSVVITPSHRYKRAGGAVITGRFYH